METGEAWAEAVTDSILIWLRAGEEVSEVISPASLLDIEF
jgi:hypothetical protein